MRIIALALSIFSFAACAAPQIQVRTVYKDVFIPVGCDAEQPARPKADKDVEIMVIKLIEYTKLLEIALKTCKKEVTSERTMD